eukprot:CAMPEP_0175688620 /NCGR_PEP_ID=MMETSP0097-20121207/28971_1 /TAXON_ID=311494 /ORGANISM="Alexandrium monilatum, Strain CCMP3105" /LENGTH=180 /DNA_ID=CAMNT_0016995635 /DNA_START=693 /DNA_END=1232 /DNA_ORIENTATION=+
MRHAVARVQHNPRGPAGGVQREHGLRRNEERGHTKGLEEDLRGLLAVPAGVERRLGEQHRVLFGDDLHLRVYVAPDEFHVVPVLDDAVCHGVLQGQDATELLRALPNEGAALGSPGHDPHVLRPADVGGEGALHGLLAGEARFHDARAVVNDHGLVGDYILVLAVHHRSPLRDAARTAAS